MRYAPIPARLFADRRKALMRKMKKGTVALISANDQRVRTADQHFPFRQNSDLFRLCGIEQPETFLFIDPSAEDPAQREMLFILPRDPMKELWTGERLSPAAARRISGITSVHSLTRLDAMTRASLAHAKTVYSNRPFPDPDAPGNSPVMNRLQALLAAAGVPQVHAAADLLTPLAMIKHRDELDLMRTAINVTDGAFRRVIETLIPGMTEYELEAEITHHFTACGCYHAYDPIIATGASACILHYTANDKVIPADALVLLDFGASYANMSADLSRTLPASGRFTPRQRAIYDAVLRVLEETTDMMRPGMTLPDLNRASGKLIERELVKLKLATRFEIRRQDKKDPIRKRYFMHGIGHHLGYDVHDAGDRNAAFTPGMVITCEPGLYIREEKTGIRLENDILITRGRPVNLMANIPIHAEEIESLMLGR